MSGHQISYSKVCIARLKGPLGIFGLVAPVSVKHKHTPPTRKTTDPSLPHRMKAVNSECLGHPALRLDPHVDALQELVLW